MVVHWEAARDLAARGYQVTGEMREQSNCTPVRFSRWEKKHFSKNKLPGFTLPQIGDLFSLNHLPKGKNLLLGVQPLGAEDSTPTLDVDVPLWLDHPCSGQVCDAQCCVCRTV